MKKNKGKKSNNHLVIYYSILIIVVTVSMLHLPAIMQFVESISERDPAHRVIMGIIILAPDLLSLLIIVHFIADGIKKRKLRAKCEKTADIFINITHEMKAPLSVILGAIQVLEKNNPENSRVPRYFDIIRLNCLRLVRLINNILDISRLQSGYMNLNLTNCNLVCLAEEITRSVVPFAEQKGLRVEFDTENEEIITAVDVEKMERILLNLLSNAIKFSTRNGTIQVRVQEKNSSVAIHVIDSGPGIPENMQSQIFERYKQVGSDLTRHAEGSGIGLAIVKAFIELHGGSISVSSKHQKGSTFTIELPIRLCEKQAVEKFDAATSERIIDVVKIELSDIYTVA